MKCLTPYRGTRYHLKEWGIGRLKPRTKQELFNLRHAQLRNCIERIFGILKMRFLVLSRGVRYDLKYQVYLVLGLCVIHNFIRLRGVRSDRFEQEADAELEAPANPEDANQNVPNEEPDSEAAKAWRDGIATRMWNQYQVVVARRQRN